MHIFFSGIGGTGIGPLALIAKQAGYEVSGSDMQDSQYIEYLKKHGIDDITIGQTSEDIARLQAQKPIDWFVYSSALPLQNPQHPELVFCRSNNIKHSKRDEFLNHVLNEKGLKMLAVAGTHGKTTTTAMAIWLFKQLQLPVSYSVGAKINFGDMGNFDSKSEYFVYECDEFDRNFLAFSPYISLITGLAWDHHDIYPTWQDYKQAFIQFIDQSEQAIIWEQDEQELDLNKAKGQYIVLEEQDAMLAQVKLLGHHNKQNAWLAIQAVQRATGKSIERLVDIINTFPGLSRRFEYIAPNLVTDYAHTPEKIAGCLQMAHEITDQTGQNLVVIYEPLTNQRIHHTINEHGNLFDDAEMLYWVPSYLARENPMIKTYTPDELVARLSDKTKQHAKSAKLDENLKKAIEQHLQNKDLVVCLSGGGGNSLDEWLRSNFSNDT